MCGVMSSAVLKNQFSVDTIANIYLIEFNSRYVFVWLNT